MESLKPYANDRQSEVIDAVIKFGSATKAAAHLGVNRRAVDRMITRVKAKAAKQGYAPDHDMVQTVPDGFGVKGVSTLYDADGNVSAQWVKSQIDPDQLREIYEQAVSAMAETMPREKAVKKPTKGVNSDLLSLYVITDYHLGMLSWGEETGADWDIKIAEDLLVNWFLSAVQAGPKSKVGILGQLGDLLHYDGMEAVTPASGHILDADSRFQKVVRVAIRAFRRIVREMLNHHEQVHIIHAEGNHDPASSVWLRELFAALYEDEPRVTVELSPDPYYNYEWGKTGLYFHHGHKKKLSAIDEVFVAKFREVYGRTLHSYGHMGHFHHKHVLETTLMEVEQHRTLASPDAYASRGGYMSGRSATKINYHKEHGEVGRFIISPEMVS